MPDSADPRVDLDLVDTVSAFFDDRSTFDVVAAAELNGVPKSLWDEADELGLTRIGIPESAGGSGGTLLDAVTVLRLAARRCAPIPLVETHIAGWLLGRAGLDPALAPHPAVALPADDRIRVVGSQLHGVLDDVAFATDADSVVVPIRLGDYDHVAVITHDRNGTTSGRDIAGGSRGRIALTGGETVSLAPVDVTRAEVDRRAALLRSAQIAGAIEAASELTRRFTADRVQFGKPVAAFQAVQAHLVALAQAEAIVTLSVERAAIVASRTPGDFEVWATALLAAEYARSAARAAHQAHGAIGMTKEYPLHHITRRLHAWRTLTSSAAGVDRLFDLARSRPGLLHSIFDDDLGEPR